MTTRSNCPLCLENKVDPGLNPQHICLLSQYQPISNLIQKQIFLVKIIT